MAGLAEPAALELAVQADKRRARLAAIAALMIALASDFSPPFLRLVGSKAWTSLGITEAQWSVLIATRSLFFIIFILAAGLSADFWGRRWMLLSTLAGFLLCTVVMIVIPNESMFGFIYALLSILSIMLRTLTITVIILLFSEKERALPVFIYSGCVALASVLSPVLARAIAQNVGFKAVFILPLLLGLAGFVLAVKYIPESRGSDRVGRRNVIALAAWVFGLCMLIFSAVLAGGLRWTHPLVLSTLGLGALLMLALKWLEGVRLPQRWRYQLLSGRLLNVAILAGVVQNIAILAIATQLLNFLIRVKGFSLIFAGLGLSPILASAILMSGLAARLAGRTGLVRSLALSLVIVAIPAAALSLLYPDIPYWVLVPFLLLLGFGFILGNSPRLLLLDSSVPKNLSATVQAIGSATSQLGGGLAYSFMLTLVENFGLQAYIDELKSYGLTRIQISARLLSLAEASEEISLILPDEAQSDVLQQLDQIFQQAYITGLSRAMLALAGVCLFTAAFIYLELRSSEIWGNRSGSE